MIGSMLVPNPLGERTLLVLREDEATVSKEDQDKFTPEDVVNHARAELAKQKANPSPPEGHIKFLETWLKKVVSQIEGRQKANPSVPPSVPSSYAQITSKSSTMDLSKGESTSTTDSTKSTKE